MYFFAEGGGYILFLPKSKKYTQNSIYVRKFVYEPPPHLQDAAAAGFSSAVDTAIDTVPSKVGKQVLQEGKRTVQEAFNINHLPRKRRTKGF